MAGRLSDRLDAHFGAGMVFMDVESITPGGDFVKAIENAIGSCSVLLAIVGSRWLTITDEHGRRRIDLPEDFVALEIGSGLARGIPTIPVLIDGATPLRKDDGLPPPLAALPHLQALRVDHERFRSDAANLIATIESILSVDDRRVGPREISKQQGSAPLEESSYQNGRSTEIYHAGNGTDEPSSVTTGRPQKMTDRRRPQSRSVAAALLTTCVAVALVGFLTWPTGGSGDGHPAPPVPTPPPVTSISAPTDSPVSGAIFSDDFSTSSLDPAKWKPASRPDVIQQAGGHLHFSVRPGSGIDYAKLEPLLLSGPFTDVRFTVTIPTFGRGGTGGGSFVINPKGPQPQIMTFSPGDAGGVIAYPLTCDKPQCHIATYADFTESSYHYPTPPKPADTLAIEITRQGGHLVYAVNGAVTGATKNDTGPLTDFWFAVSADSQESWDLLIDNLIVR